MKYAGRARNPDRSTIIYNAGIILSGIPAKAQDYRLGTRSALDWLIDRYQVRTHKASGITNDPNDWGAELGEPHYILDLVKRVTTVSVSRGGHREIPARTSHLISPHTARHENPIDPSSDSPRQML